MKVTFGGIYNIKINQDYSPKDISYIFNGQKKDTLAKYEGYELSCNLTDDQDGNHLSQFKEIQKKCPFDIFDKTDDTKIIIAKKSYLITDLDAGVAIYFYQQDFNNQNVSLANPSARKYLPIHSFMAKLTKEILNMIPRGETRAKEIVNELHQTTTDNAVDFIENIM